MTHKSTAKTVLEFLCARIHNHSNVNKKNLEIFHSTTTVMNKEYIKEHLFGLN